MRMTIEAVVAEAAERARRGEDPDWPGVLRLFGLVDPDAPAGAVVCPLPASDAAHAELTQMALALRPYASQDPQLDTVVAQLGRHLKISALAADVFEGYGRGVAWLRRPNRALGGEVPVDLLDTDEGYGRVERLVQRIDAGAYS